MTVPNQSSARIFASFVRGSEHAADELFHRYLRRLSHLARSRLAPRLARRVDAEDVVMSAYRSFFVGARAGRFDIQRPGDLWALLTTITLRKLYRTATHHSAEKRDVAREADLSDDFDLHHWVASREPGAEEAVALADEVQNLLQSLSQQHRRIVELRLQGEHLEDIATEVGASERTVRRALAKIQDDMQLTNGGAPAVCSFEQVESEPVSPPQVRLPAVSIPFEELTLKKLIGSGGMGKVYRAEYRETQRPVAVKFLQKSFQKNPETVARFLDEARIIGQLQHSGIVGMHGVGATAAGIYFIVMDLIEGVSLEELSAPPEEPTLIRWMTELADALQSAHEASVVHCDLKPSNVMKRTDGRLVLTDFGLARMLHNAESQRRSMAGTASWIAPEQVDDSFGPVTPKTDVYGLGALLYTLLTRKPPFAGKRASDILSRVISAEQPAAPSTVRSGIPADLERLCLQCLEKQQDSRPESMADVARVLRQIDV